MTTRSSKSVLLFAIMVAVITFGFGVGGAWGRECAGQPDMTAFGFVAPARPTCDRDFDRKAIRPDDRKVPYSCRQTTPGDSGK
jgi:hypothetical protein